MSKNMCLFRLFVLDEKGRRWIIEKFETLHSRQSLREDKKIFETFLRFILWKKLLLRRKSKIQVQNKFLSFRLSSQCNELEKYTSRLTADSLEVKCNLFDTLRLRMSSSVLETPYKVLSIVLDHFSL